MIRYWNHLVSLDDNRLTKKIFLWDYALQQANWSSDICNIFDDLNFETDNLFHIDLHVSEHRLRHEQSLLWFDNVRRKPKLRTYILFKNDYRAEPYVTMFLPRRQRSLLAQFRAGVLPLRIETGRFRREPVDNRICIFCNQNAIENEVHFLLHCSLYNDLRELFLKSDMDNWQLLPDVEKLKLFMQSDVKGTANFIDKAFSRRKEILYDES